MIQNTYALCYTNDNDYINYNNDGTINNEDCIT